MEKKMFRTLLNLFCRKKIIARRAAMTMKTSQIRHTLAVSPNILLNSRRSAADCNTSNDINNSKCFSFLRVKVFVQNFFPEKILYKGLFITANIGLIPLKPSF